MAAGRLGDPAAAERDQVPAVIRSYIVPRIGQVRLQSALSGPPERPLCRARADGLSVSTRKLVHAVIGRALRDAERWGRVPATSPGWPTRPAPRSRRRRHGLPASSPLPRSRRATIGSSRSGDSRPPPECAAASSAAITWRSLDLDGARLEVSQQLVPTRGGASFGPPKSARARRTIALDAETVEALRRHRDAQLLERDFAGDAYGDQDLVFCDELGAPIHPQRLTEWFRATARPPGSRAARCTSEAHGRDPALTSGVPVHIVAARLGDTPQTVLGTYAHLLPYSDEVAAERVAAALAR